MVMVRVMVNVKVTCSALPTDRMPEGKKMHLAKLRVGEARANHELISALRQLEFLKVSEGLDRIGHFVRQLPIRNPMLIFFPALVN